MVQLSLESGCGLDQRKKNPKQTKSNANDPLVLGTLPPPKAS